MLNILAQPDEGTPSFNDTTDREVAQFGSTFPRILRTIWKVDPSKGPVRASNMDVTDAYHHGTLRPYQVGVFTCVILLAADDDCIIVSIDLVLPMVWVDSPKFFRAFSETLTEVANALIHTSLLVPGHGAVANIPESGPGLPLTLDIITYIE